MGMSRNEDILQAIIDGTDSSPFKPPQSREEYLLIQILDKLNEGGGGSISMHICSSDEYDPYTLVPTVANPDSNTFYLVPSANAGTDIYDEWVHIENYWEKFGSGGRIISAIPASASISNTGLITWKNGSNEILFTLQLPLYNGGVS